MSQQITNISDWTIRVYRLSESRRQRRVIDLLQSGTLSDVVVQGATSGPSFFVVVEYGSAASEELVERVIGGIDPGFERTYECEASPEAIRTLATWRHQRR